MVAPLRHDSGLRGPVQLDAHGINPNGEIHWNLEGDELIIRAIGRDEGVLSKHGVLVTNTGDRTGRSPNDKFIVKEESVEDNIWWGDVNVPTTRVVFDNLREKVREYLKSQPEPHAFFPINFLS